ncbi:unnamed protein product [Leptosia nina]|uniref:THAP-type domain-containing protein n=1 Tax=Leptosia nina TaxID=320188 RepID=A0AAV1J9I0_9NEOP
MPKCSFSPCKNKTSRYKKADGVSYFRFPRNPTQCAKWASIVSHQRNESYKPNRSSVVCSEHFASKDLYITDKGIKRILKTAIPQIKEGICDNVPPIHSTSSERTVNESPLSDDLLGDMILEEQAQAIENMILDMNDIPSKTASMSPLLFEEFEEEYNENECNDELERIPSPDIIDLTLDPLDRIYFRGELDKRRKRMIEIEKVTNVSKTKGLKNSSKSKPLKKLKQVLKSRLYAWPKVPEIYEVETAL